MTQYRIHFETGQQAANRLSPLIEALFEEDGFPVASFETDEARALWTLSVYVGEGELENAKSRLLDLVQGRSGENEIGPVGVETLDDENWVEKTLQDLAPVRAGRFVVHGTHDEGCAAAHEFSINIDAGMAFGTGHHGTTAGCLAMIDRELKRTRPRNALDLGSGTGVLAIAIAKATHIPVLATDIDPVAARIARDNAEENGVGAYVESIAATGFNHRRFAAYVPFDLVVANILAGPLQSMAHDFSLHLASNAKVILSGLLPHQKARILSTYRVHGLALDHAHYQDGWMTLVLRNMR